MGVNSNGCLLRGHSQNEKGQLRTRLVLMVAIDFEAVKRSNLQRQILT